MAGDEWGDGPTAEPALPPDLREQLRDAREQFRIERGSAAAALAARTKRIEKAEAELRTEQTAVAAEKKRIRALYAKCLDRIRIRWASERKSCGQARADCDAAEGRFREFHARKKGELDRRTTVLDGDRERLRTAWELLAEGQRRAIADRRQTEDWLARQVDAHELRTKMFREQHTLFEANRQSHETRMPQLLAEIAGLEARATNLRRAVSDLEAGRDKSDGTGTAPASHLAVPLAGQSGVRGEAHQVDSLLGELTREKRGLTHARTALDRQTEELADRRAVLAEQVQALAGVRDLWQTAVSQSAGELHAIALGIRSEEQALAGRERDLLAAERRRRSEDHALVELRFKLENWQLALMAKEASVQTDADKLDARLAARTVAAESRESSLEATAEAWSELRRRELDFFRAELDRLEAVRSEFETAGVEFGRLRDECAERIRAVAARELAGAGPRPGSPATRRGRIFERRWTSHLVREEKRLAKREAKLGSDRFELDERSRGLYREFESFLERKSEEIAVRTAYELDRLAAERRLSDARLEAELETQLRFRTEADARRLRAEMARMAESIRTANFTHPDEPDVVILPLQPARAA